jgi:hypothetical protein
VNRNQAELLVRRIYGHDGAVAIRKSKKGDEFRTSVAEKFIVGVLVDGPDGKKYLHGLGYGASWEEAFVDGHHTMAKVKARAEEIAAEQAARFAAQLQVPGENVRHVLGPSGAPAKFSGEANKSLVRPNGPSLVEQLLGPPGKKPEDAH